MEHNDSLIGRATAAIEEVLEGVERDLDRTGMAPSRDALAGRRALAEMIARSLHGRGMLHDPDRSPGSGSGRPDGSSLARL
jgi:hypothetical protein